MASKHSKTAAVSSSSARSLKQKSKPNAVKRPLSTIEKLKRLFNSLCAQIDGGHFSNAIRTCDKSMLFDPSFIRYHLFMFILSLRIAVLKLEPTDTDAVQTKLFLLLQTEQYSAALSLIDGQDEHAFERAYSLYRLHQEEEVEELLADMKRSPSEDERGVIHLEAQMVCIPHLRLLFLSYRCCFPNSRTIVEDPTKRRSIYTTSSSIRPILCVSHHTLQPSSNRLTVSRLGHRRTFGYSH